VGSLRAGDRKREAAAGRRDKEWYSCGEGWWCDWGGRGGWVGAGMLGRSIRRDRKKEEWREEASRRAHRRVDEGE